MQGGQRNHGAVYSKTTPERFQYTAEISNIRRGIEGSRITALWVSGDEGTSIEYKNRRWKVKPAIDRDRAILNFLLDRHRY